MEAKAVIALRPVEVESGVDTTIEKRYFVRLNESERAQHIIFVGCFVILIVTGFMVKLPDWIVDKLGETKNIVFSVRSILHRLAGVVMILTSVYHVYYLLFKPSGRRWLFDILPRPGDLKDMIMNMLYLLGVRDAPPAFDRFSYKQKLEYGALIAGTVLMSLTGLLLWTEYLWDKFILDIASLVHGMEAILAGLAIMVWHMYEVHFKSHKFPLDNLWLTGVIDEEEMKEEHRLHYEKIMKDAELQEIYIRKGP